MKGHLHLPHPHSQCLQRIQAPTYERLQARPAEDHSEPIEKSLSIHCGWGRLPIGQTYSDAEELVCDPLQEAPGERDIALYVAAPQQVLAHALQQFFLDPSNTLRLWSTDYRPARRPPRGFRIRRIHIEEGWAAINHLYLACSMLPVQTEHLSPHHQGGPICWLAGDADTGAAVGTAMGLNNAKAFQDPEGGFSLRCLAMDPQYSRPGIGEALVWHLVEHFMSRELIYLDPSVLHSNQQTKALYRELGLRELATFTTKRKNGINQSLFLGPDPEEDLSPYAQIVVDETHRRGVEVYVDGAEGGLFTLTQGGWQIRCREPLSDLTTAVSMTFCQGKALTHCALQHAGLRQSRQRLAGSAEEDAAFLARHGLLVAKPVDGEQGQGVAVDLCTVEEVEEAIEAARHLDSRVLLESYHVGHDLRALVVGYEMVVAAIRRPVAVIGDSWHNIRELIEAQSRRRQTATGWESRIPLDHETERTLQAAGYGYDDVPSSGEYLAVRRATNLHIGGILEDVTDALHPAPRETAIQVARTPEIPVVGPDFLAEAADQPNYVIIEANECIGLVNHEPRPTVERFVDLLFPLSREVPS